MQQTRQTNPPGFNGSREADHWSRVFAARIAKGSVPAIAELEADAALRAYKRRRYIHPTTLTEGA